MHASLEMRPAAPARHAAERRETTATNRNSSGDGGFLQLLRELQEAMAVEIEAEATEENSESEASMEEVMQHRILELMTAMIAEDTAENSRSLHQMASVDALPAETTSTGMVETGGASSMLEKFLQKLTQRLADRTDRQALEKISAMLAEELASASAEESAAPEALSVDRLLESALQRLAGEKEKGRLEETLNRLIGDKAVEGKTAAQSAVLPESGSTTGQSMAPPMEKASLNTAAPSPAPESTGPPQEPVTLKEVQVHTVKNVRYLLANGKKTISVRLIPESLGELRIEVHTRGEDVGVRLVSASPVVREALEGQLSMLRDSLQQQGIRLNSVEVSPDSYAGMEKENAFDRRASGGMTSWKRGRYPSGGGTVTQSSEVMEPGNRLNILSGQASLNLFI